MTTLKPVAMGHGPWAGSSARRKRGLTLIEVLIVLTIAGTLMAIAYPKAQLTLDRISVHSAASDLQLMLSSAREFALASHSTVAVDFADPKAGVRVHRGSDVFYSRNIASAHGVKLTSTRDSLAYGPLGLGVGAANLSIIVRRRAAVETVFVSRLGRVR
jgi:prepilin-type N-terminal cleavage/methylation domain-containing protein